MNGEQRRKQLLSFLSGSQTPISGAALARELKVSRQVIVQDVALLRANGADILSASALSALGAAAHDEIVLRKRV